MGKLPIVIWIIAAPTLMGIFVLTVLVVPSLADDAMRLILPVAAAGAVVAMPVSYVIARLLNAAMKKPASGQ